MNRPCGQWVNGREPAPKKNTVPARSFRFTKAFTERCWSNRRGRHKLFRIRQNGQPQPDQRPAAFAVLDHHLGGIFIQHLQPFRNISHADPDAPKTIGAFEQLRCPHAHAVIFHLDHKPRFDHSAAQRNAAAFDLRRKSVLDAVFDQRLQQHARHHSFQRRGIEILDDLELVPSKTYDFNVQIIVDELHFLAQRDERIRTVQQTAKNGSEFQDHLPRRIGIEAHQRRNGIQRIEQEVRVDLILQRRHARLQQQPFLFFQLYLDANAVEDFQFRAHPHDYRKVDRALHQIPIQSSSAALRPQARAFQAEDGIRPEVPDLRLQETQAHDGGEKSDLPIEHARPRQIAPNHAIEGEVDERRERPDVFLFGREAAQPPGDNSGKHIQWQARPLAIHDRRQRYQRSPDPSREAPADHTQQQRRFERQVAGAETLDAASYPDAKRDRDRHPERQINFVPGFALLTEDQTLEFFGAHQRARHGRGHAQLDQEIDEYQPRFQHRMNLLVESRAPRPAASLPDGRGRPSLHRMTFCPQDDALRSGSASDCTRCLLQKLLDVDIRARRDSTLREVAASTAAPSDGRQNLLEQRPHISSAGGSLRENQTRRIHSARHQRDRRRRRSSHFLRKQFGKADVTIGKHAYDYLAPVDLRLIMERGQSHKLGKLIERIILLLAQQLALFDTLADLIPHIPELRRKKCGRLAESTIVTPGHANCTTAADKLYSCSLPHLLGFPQQNRTDLPARANMSSATGRQIEFRDLDQPQLVMLRGRQFTQPQLLRLCARNIANRHGTVLKHNFIGSLLRPPHLLRT